MLSRNQWKNEYLTRPCTRSLTRQFHRTSEGSIREEEDPCQIKKTAMATIWMVRPLSKAVTNMPQSLCNSVLHVHTTDTSSPNLFTDEWNIKFCDQLLIHGVPVNSTEMQLNGSDVNGWILTKIYITAQVRSAQVLLEVLHTDQLNIWLQ